MGKLCSNTQYFVIEKRVGVGKPRKRWGSWQVWTPYPQNQWLWVRNQAWLRPKIFEVIICPGYKSSLLLTSTLVNLRVQIGVISNCVMHTILVWKLEVLSKGPYLRPVHCARCARSCSREYLPEPCLTVASLFRAACSFRVTWFFRLGSPKCIGPEGQNPQLCLFIVEKLVERPNRIYSIKRRGVCESLSLFDAAIIQGRRLFQITFPK